MAVNPLDPHRIGIVALTPESWGGQVMGRHHLLTRLSKRFPVVWLDQRPGWREVPRVCLAQAGASPDRAPVPGLPSFRVLSPSPFFPKIYRPRTARMLIDRLSIMRARKRLEDMGCAKIVLSVWRPEFLNEALSCPEIPVVYHVADEYSFSSIETPTPLAEQELLRHCKAAICVSHALREKKAPFAAASFVIPNGVDSLLFSTPTDEPPELTNLPHPRIGYVGSIKKWLDLALLATLARRRPEWTFVLAGPVGNVAGVTRQLEELRAYPNVSFLGFQESTRLPAFMQHMDVVTVPYLRNDYTKYISPLKLYEYLAAGTPIVSSRIPAALELEPEVRIADGVAKWEEAICEALGESAEFPKARQARQRAAAKHDWATIADQVADVISGVVDRSKENS